MAAAAASVDSEGLPHVSAGADTRFYIPAVWLCVFVQMLGVGVTISTLPLFLTSIGASPTQLSVVIACFSAAQMLGCPALVSLSSRIGRLPVLLMCLAGAAGANLLTAMSSTVAAVAAARVLAGLFAASIPVAQAAVTDRSGGGTTSRLALISAATSSGAVLGPAFAATLSAVFAARGVPAGSIAPYTFGCTAILAAGACGCGATFAALTRVGPPAARSQLAGSGSNATAPPTALSTTPPAASSTSQPLSPALLRLLPVSAACSWLVTQGISTYTLFSATFLGYTQANIGALFSTGALAGIGTQLLILPELAKRLGERMCCALGCATMGSAFILCSLLRTQPAHTIWYLLYRIGLAVADTTTSALIVRFSPSPQSRGRNLALAQSCQAGTRIFSPLVSFWLYERSLNSARAPGALPFVFAGTLALGAASMPLSLPKAAKAPSSPKSDPAVKAA